MDAPRLTISPTLRKRMDYGKFARRPVRVLILESQYWVDQACASAAERLGWRVARVRVAMQGVMSRDLLQGFFQALVDLRPDFVLSINLSGMDTDGMFARFLADLELPHVTWFVDDPRTILMGRTSFGSPYAVALTWEEAYGPYLEACGFAAVHTLPLALDETVFTPVPAVGWVHPPTFVAHSMQDYSAREWANVQTHPGLAERVEASFREGRVTRAAFATGIDSLLDSGAGEWDAEARRHAEMAFFIEGTRRLRQELVEALAPEGLHVRGDEHWQSVTAQWGPGLRYTDELPQFYRECPVNLNSTSIQMDSAVNQRVFDCPGAGGFLLTDAQSSLENLFDAERETVRYRTLDEARDLLRWFLARPQSRREFIERAQRRIRGEHTYRHRLESILTLLRERYGS